MIFTDSVPVPLTVLANEWTLTLSSPAHIIDLYMPNDSSANYNFRLLAAIADNGTDFLGNEYRSCVIQTDAENISTTGGLNPVTGSGTSFYWMSNPAPSPYAVSSLYFNVATGTDPTVIDGILIDPATPGMDCNIYWTNDTTNDSDQMTEEDWEGKLWTRVPQIITCNARREFVLPSSIYAKYVKLEFVNPQARPYQAGQWQTPILYKKFPQWVTNYFYNQWSLPIQTTQVVGIQSDMLSLAYIPSTDNLIQTPVTPIATPDQIVAPTPAYFDSAQPLNPDSNTLSQIPPMTNPYISPMGGLPNLNSSLGQKSYGLFNQQGFNAIPVVVEGTYNYANSLATVSTSFRESVWLQQTEPDMYFYLTSRHAYAVAWATFDNDMAYFCGVNELAFIRHIYTTPDDTPIYLESNGDGYNALFSDFTLDESGYWSTY